MSEPRSLSEPFGLRLFADQREWLALMETERSANQHAIIRAAVDYYRPVYEANGQGQTRLAAQVAELVAELGEDRVRTALEQLAIETTPAG